ncbi:hypothetical protein POPTR_006G083850v4 [Populus trichocarpa]|uniref:Uncharacterized protein n=1 Tax=Populus trichocarpa TaxID=3694 RepID=A0ACC0ST48_POPTR|nr:hypothetical protein POPTR_006G083850v4 [Populus trichocarpa]
MLSYILKHGRHYNSFSLLLTFSSLSLSNRNQPKHKSINPLIKTKSNRNSPSLLLFWCWQGISRLKLNNTRMTHSYGPATDYLFRIHDPRTYYRHAPCGAN